MRRLTGLDASFLYLETPNNHMHVAGTYIFDPSDVPGGYSFDRVKELIGNRLHKLPPFRWRLVEVPFGLHHPIWIEDPDFDLDYHVRRTALPDPGGMKELAEFAAEVMSRPLDRRRPLWETHIVEGLEHGYVAMISKTHHAAIDGASGAELSTNLFDLTAEPEVFDAPEWKPERIPSDSEMLVYALNSLSKQPALFAKAVKDTVTMALTLRNRPVPEGITPPPAPFTAPRTSLNAPITPHRSFAMGEISLEEIKKIRKQFGGTVNDVVLAICAGALRQYLIAGSELPVEPLVAMVPISVRSADQKGAMGNRVSNMFVALATNIVDPVERLQAIQRGTTQAKEQANAIGADTLSNWAEFAAPAVAARAARLYSSMKLADKHRPLFNLTISNVPGPQAPLYSAGAKLVAWYPMGPIFDGGALNMTVMSYCGVVYFGLVACRELVRVDELSAYVNDSAAELVKAAEQGHSLMADLDDRDRGQPQTAKAKTTERKKSGTAVKPKKAGKADRMNSTTERGKSVSAKSKKAKKAKKSLGKLVP
jgi:diacylglycerol O-acyltransferase / wax synthase